MMNGFKTLLSVALVVCLLFAFPLALSAEKIIYAYDDLRYTFSDECMTIVAYVGSDETVHVPNIILGYPVSVIGEGAFVDNAARVVYLPDTVMQVEEGAFGENVSVVFSGQGTTYETDHHWVEDRVIKKATCIEPGSSEFKCSICGAREERVVKKGAHVFGTAKVEYVPTCEFEGVVSHVCKLCGETELEMIGTVDYHVYDNSCDPACNLCGAARPIKHTKGDGVAHYTENGHYYYCAVCGAPFDDAEHSFKTADGVTKCTVCGYVSDIAPEHKHNIVRVDAAEPGCTEPGVREHYYCTVCNKCYSDRDGLNELSLMDISVPAFGHKPVLKAGKAPTMDKPGATDGYCCSVCGRVLLESIEIPAVENIINENAGPAVSGDVNGDVTYDTASAVEDASGDPASGEDHGGAGKKKSPVAIWSAVAIVAVGGVATVALLVSDGGKNKKKNKK